MDVGFFYGLALPWDAYQRQTLTNQYLFLSYSVKNHGIPEQTIETVITASKLFFSMPEEAKLKVGGVLVVFCVFIVFIDWRSPHPNCGCVA